jgi:tripartite-type tricarboxylate transporter receptor subunit TctC
MSAPSLSWITAAVRAAQSAARTQARAAARRLHAAVRVREPALDQSASRRANDIRRAAQFSPIILVGHAPNVLVVHPSVPAKTVKELITIAKARPGALAFASNGAGSLSHLTGALFMQRAGISMLHVPYKGAAPAVIETVAGHVSVLFAAYGSVSGQEHAGKLKALAVTSTRRIAAAPRLPTVAEAALPGFESTQWWGVYGPAGLAAGIVSRLNAELNQILRTADTQKRLAADGAEPAGGTPAELAAYHQADYEKWGKLIRDAGIKGE